MEQQSGFAPPNERDRRVKAYKESFDCGDLKDPVINGRAINKMNGKEVRARIKHLYTLEKDTIISDERWTRDKSEQALLDIIGDFETKHGDRLKAIDTLNKMRGIGTPEVEQVETDDSVAIFFKKFKSET